MRATTAAIGYRTVSADPAGRPACGVRSLSVIIDSGSHTLGLFGAMFSGSSWSADMFRVAVRGSGSGAVRHPGQRKPVCSASRGQLRR